jgi:galactokinase
MLSVTVTRTLHSQRFGQDSALFVAPGRVNLIGEHTDYAEGFVMPAAIDFATLAAICPRDDKSVAIYSANFDDQIAYPLDSLPEKASRHWSDYPLGVVSVLREAGVEIPGFSLTLNGDVPLGAGLSSSASVEVASMVAILSITSAKFTPPEVAKLCQRAENHFVGASTGIMDQFIACCGAEDHALLLDCRTLEYRFLRISVS